MRTTRTLSDTLIAIQSALHRDHGVRTDVHYREGSGALFVPEGALLTPANVIAAYSESELAIMTLTRAI